MAVILLIPMSFLGMKSWKDRETVWQTIVTRYPNFATARLSLGEELHRLGRIEESKKSIQKA